ncbi:MAG: O-antigen ligase family protein [Verrucomicrobiaceae bacterium]|nr:O-antigen ligase family protein [Verrucomicrobiaceae bacterium]
MAAFYAPLAYGGTTRETRMILDLLCLLVAVAWVPVLVVEKRTPRAPAYLLTALAALFLLGLGFVLNPMFRHLESLWVFLPTERSVAWLPGTCDLAATAPWLGHLGCLALLLLVVTDAASRPGNRWFLLQTIALSGFAIALIGMTQKAGAAEAMLWATPQQSGGVFFAAFRYHANAASYLNLCWPAALAVWLRSRHLHRRGWISSWWLTVFLLTLLGVFVNTSKAGQVLALLGILISLWLVRRLLFDGTQSRATLLVSAIVCLSAALVVLLPTLLQSADNWDNLLSEGQSWRGRKAAASACLAMIADNPLFGTGPGTFHLAFPFYTSQLEGFHHFWTHAHQDYLQTMVEWGLPGFAAWAVLFAGAILRGGQRNRKTVPHENLSDKFALLALALVLIHAMVDFPLQIPAIQLAAAIPLGILWSSRRTRAQGTKKPARSG